MAAILLLGAVEENERIPRNLLLPPRAKAFNLPEVEFIENFRLNKQLAKKLIEELRMYLEPNTARANAFSAETKILTALRFFASGSYQKNIGNDYLCCMSKRSVSNCVRHVADAMTTFLLQKYVVFPTERREQEAIKLEFFDYGNINGVIGAIDCTHVAIVAPHDDGFHHERNYVNRKGFHSINVQLVCDMFQKILNVVARFPGCTHDSYIWKSSNLRVCFQHHNFIQGNGRLLGDSGYPREQWLHVPFTNPANQQEIDYNIAHSRARSVIERCNGTLKSRFRCLLKQRTLHYSPEAAAKIINSCIILHNMCIENNLQWDDWEVPEEDRPFDTCENENDV